MAAPSGPPRDPSATRPPGADDAEPRAAALAPARQRWRLYLAIPATAEAERRADANASRGWLMELASSGLPIAGDSSGRPRGTWAAQLPLGVAGEREILDLFVTERLGRAAVRAAVAAGLPVGWALVDLHDVWLGAPAAPASVVAADYRVLVEGAARWELEAAALALLGSGELPRARAREKRTIRYDLRPLLLRLAVVGSDAAGVTLAIRLRHGTDAVGRPEEVVAALGEPPAGPLGQPLAVRGMVRSRLVMADDPDARG